MFAVKAKVYGVLYNQASSIAFDVTSSYWLLISRLFIGHHAIIWYQLITRVLHLPKRTETSLITESDHFGPIR